MLRQLFHIIWFQRRNNAWIVGLLFVVTVLLWYAFDLLYNYEVQGARPLGFSPDGLYSVEFRYNRTKPGVENTENDMRINYNAIMEYPEIESACYFMGDRPFSDSRVFEGYCSVEDSGRTVATFVRYVSDSFFDVMKINPIYGRFDPDAWHESSNPVPVVVTRDFADSLFRNPADAVGQRMYNPYILQAGGNTTYIVTAVVANQKSDRYRDYAPMVYLPPAERYFSYGTFVVKARKEYRRGFEERFMDTMGPKLERGVLYLLGAQSWKQMSDDYDVASGTVSYLNIARGIIGFFLFTVFLIILGTFMMRTRQRRHEIAVRMALGSSRRGLRGFLLAEGMILLAIAILPAVSVALLVAWHEMTVNTLLTMDGLRFVVCFLMAVTVIAIIITVAILPAAFSVMRIDPAIALKEE